MQTALENIRNMVDVNTIIGDELKMENGTIILPVSKVYCGFAAGGNSSMKITEDESGGFGGGTGAGVSVKPVGFLICGSENIRFLSIEKNSWADQLTDYIPQALEAVQDAMSGRKEANPS
jgi:sporulation protein YtfJ